MIHKFTVANPPVEQMCSGLTQWDSNFVGLENRSMTEQKDIIIYRTPDGKSSVALFASGRILLQNLIQLCLVQLKKMWLVEWRCL